MNKFFVGDIVYHKGNRKMYVVSFHIGNSYYLDEMANIEVKTSKYSKGYYINRYNKNKVKCLEAKETDLILIASEASLSKDCYTGNRSDFLSVPIGERLVSIHKNDIERIYTKYSQLKKDAEKEDEKKVSPSSEEIKIRKRIEAEIFNMAKAKGRNKTLIYSYPEIYSDLVITSDNKKKITVSYKGCTGKAKCHPEDEFNETTGFALALERLIDKLTAKELELEKEKNISDINISVACIESNSPAFEVGKIYKVERSQIKSLWVTERTDKYIIIGDLTGVIAKFLILVE